MSHTHFCLVLVVSQLCQAQSVVATATTVTYVHPGNLPNHQRQLLQAIGNRLQVPGKERQAGIATLKKYSGGTLASTSVVTFIIEMPGLLRIDDPTELESIVFNGSATLSSKGAASSLDTDIVESVVYDTVEGFMSSENSGSHTVLNNLASRIVDARTSNGLSGTCTLYNATGVVQATSAKIQSAKTFCFDAVTHLLKETWYQRNGVSIETRFGSWAQFGDQFLPTSITRLENNLPVFTLTFQTISLGQAVASDTSLITP